MNTKLDIVRSAVLEGNSRKASKACFPMYCGFTASEEWEKCIELVKSIPYDPADVYYYVLMVLDALRVGNLKEALKWQDMLISLKDKTKDDTPEKELIETAVLWLDVRIPRKDNDSVMMKLSSLYSSEMEESVRFGRLCPTAGSPGVLRGAKDVSDWGRKYKAMGNIMKPMLPSIFEDEGKGVWELFLADLFYEKNMQEEALENSELSLSAENIPIKFASLCQNAKILRLTSSREDAQKKLDEAEELIKDFPDRRMKENLNAVRARCDLELGSLERAKDYVITSSEEPKNYCPDRMFKLITQGKAYIALGRYRDAVSFFEKLISLAENDFRPLDTAECYANCAVAYRLSGNNSLAKEKLLKAVKITRPYGYIRLYADMGEVISNILEGIIDENDSYLLDIKEEADKFSLLFPQLYKFVRNSENVSAGSVKMTGTEQAVLLLLNRGLTNKEISECMNIKVTTVKFHVKNILSKLGVRNRREAVAFAKKLELID